MAKLAGLIESMATALQVPSSRVRTVAAELRRRKLLNTGPRGPGAPDMDPHDAAALLLGLMYDDEAASAPDNVEKLWIAPLSQSIATRRGEQTGDRPPHTLFNGADQDEPGALGHVLASILDWLVRYGDLSEDAGDDQPDLSVFNLSVSLEAPFHKARIGFNSFDAFWSITYQWKSPAQLEFEAAAPATRIDFRTRWDAKDGPYMASSRTVGEDALGLIADALRNHTWRDEDIEIIPPYDRCCAAEEMDG